MRLASAGWGRLLPASSLILAFRIFLNSILAYPEVIVLAGDAVKLLDVHAFACGFSLHFLLLGLALFYDLEERRFVRVFFELFFIEICDLPFHLRRDVGIHEFGLFTRPFRPWLSPYFEGFGQVLASLYE